MKERKRPRNLSVKIVLTKGSKQEFTTKQTDTIVDSTVGETWFSNSVISKKTKSVQNVIKLEMDIAKIPKKIFSSLRLL